MWEVVEEVKVVLPFPEPLEQVLQILVVAVAEVEVVAKEAEEAC